MNVGGSALGRPPHQNIQSLLSYVGAVSFIAKASSYDGGGAARLVASENS